MSRRAGGAFAACMACACMVVTPPARALVITFDYSYDGGFFTDVAANPQAAAAKAALEYAARFYEPYLDTLAAIAPKWPRGWQATFNRPDTGQSTSITNMSIPAGVVVVFVGGRVLEGTTLAVAGPGGQSAWGGRSWEDTVAYRGQTGAAASPATDFGPWGGAIAFDSDRAWNFSIDALPQSGQADFLSVAAHELAHVLGFGIADSWDAKVQTEPSGRVFVGPAAVAAYGAQVPLDGTSGHWAAGIISKVGQTTQTAALDPYINLGQRERLTELDRAGMVDIGWQMPLPGDADHDGAVEYTDCLTVKANFGGSGTWTDGDFDYDGDIDFFDFLAARANFGRSVGAVSATVGGSVTPEPSCLLLAAAGMARLALRRGPPSRRSVGRSPDGVVG